MNAMAQASTLHGRCWQSYTAILLYRRMALASLLASASLGSALGQEILSELRMGVLAHDIPVLAGQKERGADLK